jgi:hypothetical protein
VGGLVMADCTPSARYTSGRLTWQSLLNLERTEFR